MKGVCKIKHNIYLFDLGNVIVDITLKQFPGILDLDSSGGTKWTPEKIMKKYKESGINEKFEAGLISTDDFIKYSKRLFNLKCSDDTFLKAWNSLIGEEDREVAAIIQEVSDNRPVYLLSNTNEPHFSIARKQCISLKYLEGYFLSYELKVMKPDPRIYEEVSNRLGVSPGEIFFVDDREDNVSSARSVGMHAFQFHSADELREIIF